MIVNRKLLEQAVEALESPNAGLVPHSGEWKSIQSIAIAALRTQLAAPSVEPVAWMLEWTYDGECVGRRLYDDERHCLLDAGKDGGICKPLYANPEPFQPDWMNYQQGVAHGRAEAIEECAKVAEPVDGLLPCPFCGSPADDCNPDGDMEGYHIHCSGAYKLFEADEACCPLSSFSYTKHEDAVKTWNNRARPANAEELVRLGLEAAAKEALKHSDGDDDMAAIVAAAIRAIDPADVLAMKGAT